MSGVAGSQHPKYIIENSPFSLVEKKCLQAGLEMQEGGRVQTHNTITTTFKGWGPMTAYHFCQVDKFKRLGMGSGALKVPIKGQSFSDVLTFAVPPITVIHKETADGWTATIDHYLAVYNSSDLCTLPSNSNTIYKGADPTELFKRTAKPKYCRQKHPSTPKRLNPLKVSHPKSIFSAMPETEMEVCTRSLFMWGGAQTRER